MLENIKKWGMVLGTVMLLSSCSNDMEDVNPSATLSAVSTDAAKVASTLTITPSEISKSGDGTTWTFSMNVTGVNPNIGALLMNIEDCDGSNIASAVTSLVVSGKGGTYTQTLLPSYKEGNGTDCGRSDLLGYVRFTDFTGKLTDGSIYNYTLTFSKPVRVKTINAWARISNTCNAFTVNGPSCVIEELDLCGEGHGYFHKSEHWEGQTITIGGQTYTAAEGVTFITSDKKEGGSDNKGGIADSKAAFAQGATVLLNRQLGHISPTAYAAELATIEAYLSTLPKLTTYDLKSLPTGNDAAKAAAGAIGDAIDCEKDGDEEDEE